MEKETFLTFLMRSLRILLKDGTEDLERMCDLDDVVMDLEMILFLGVVVDKIEDEM